MPEKETIPQIPKKISDWIEKNADEAFVSSEWGDYSAMAQSSWIDGCEAMYHHLSPRIKELESQIIKLRFKNLEQPSDIKTAEEILKGQIFTDNLLPQTRNGIYEAMEQYASQFKSVSLPDETVEKALAFMEYAKDSDLFYDWDIVRQHRDGFKQDREGGK
jgi:hypothetical protein